jgi:hypothetical protein
LASRLSLATRGDEAAISVHVSETTPCNPRPIASTQRRLNLLLPSINASHYFGGIHTAVQIYQALVGQFESGRIVLMDSSPDTEALTRFADHKAVPYSVDSEAPRQVVDFSDRYGHTLPVSSADVWLVTAWWTAYAGQRLAAWQQECYGRAGDLAYLIQDFEPGFYPWSSQYALALSTYRPEEDIAVFNTSLLADYFAQQGLNFRRRIIFEPTLNSRLREALMAARTSEVPRDKRIVVYARPSTPRNAFELLCEGLRSWGWGDARCREWEIVAAGELRADLDLGPFRLRALGKLAIDDYAQLLVRSAVGVSLMISPHPSYPPLEMAALGMSVVTNGFGNKDLAARLPNVTSFSEFSPEAIATALTDQLDAWEARDMYSAGVLEEGSPFLATGEFGCLAHQIAEAYKL